MIDNILNIGGSEWVIIIFVALILILGTGKLPGAARKLGKAVNEYNRAKAEINDQVKAVSDTSNITGPVETEREKLETIARSLGISHKDKSDKELRDDIAKKVGRRVESDSNTSGDNEIQSS